MVASNFPELLTKHSATSDIFQFDFTNALATAEIIFGIVPQVSIVGTDPDEPVPSLIVGTPFVTGDGLKVQVRLSSGLDGITYTLRCVAFTNSANQKVECGLLKVEDC